MNHGLREQALALSCHAIQWLPTGRRSLFRACHLLTGRPSRFPMRVDGIWFMVDCGDWDVAMRVALDQAYEPAVAALFLANVHPGHVVFDVGANKGFYTLLAVQRVGSAGKVVAYEPDPRNIRDIEDDARLNDFPNLIVRGIALAARKGESEFDIGGWQEGVSAWGQLVVDGGKSSDGASTVRVPTATLDEELEELAIDNLNMLKIDIQGGELAAIDGMKGALKRGTIDTILLELHDMQLNHAECDHILNTLFEFGYDGKCYDQSEFSRAEAVGVMRMKAVPDLASKGRPARSYNYKARRDSATYVKPLQFLLSKPDARRG